MAASAYGFGRFDARATNADIWIGAGTVAALVAVPVLHTPAALAFLLLGMIQISLRPTASMTALLRHWPLLLLPALCTLSVVWSMFPALSLRYGLQLSATFVIAITLANRLPLRFFLATTFLALFLVVALSLVTGTFRADTGALVGHYGSKNAMAGAAALFTLISFGLAATPGPNRWFRVAAAAGVLVGGLATMLAQSVSAAGYLPVGIGAFIAVLSLRSLRPLARIVIGGFLVLAAVLAGILVSIHADTLSAAFTDLTGKDATLTGRTYLWRLAMELIAQRPLLGVGYQAFWVHDNAPAELIWLIFGIENRAGFNFHNTYLSNAVEIGLIGVTVQALLIGAAVYLSGRLALRTGDHGAALLFAAAVMLLAVTPIEAPVFFQFNYQSALVVMTIVYAVQGLRQTRAPN